MAEGGGDAYTRHPWADARVSEAKSRADIGLRIIVRSCYASQQSLSVRVQLA